MGPSSLMGLPAGRYGHSYWALVISAWQSRQRGMRSAIRG